MKKFVKSKMFLQVLIASFITIMVVATIASATTIGTNISTAGTLSVTDTSTLTGAVTTVADVTVGTSLAVTTSATVGTTLTVTGATALNATTTISINGTKALSVKNASGVPIFDVDTTNSRASTTGIIVPQSAVTTPRFNASSTAVSIGDGSPIAGFLFGTCGVNFGTSLVNNKATTTNCTANGVTTSYRVFMTPTLLEPNVVFNSASSTANNTIQVQIFNSTSTTLTIAEHTWYWMAIK